MLEKRNLIILMTLLTALTFISSGCFLQPITKIERKSYFIDLDAPAVRLKHPVKAEILIWDEEKKQWVDGGKTELPAGGYFKGRKPPKKIKEDIQ